MNWEQYKVDNTQLLQLQNHNEPIPVPSGNLTANAGVEVYSLEGGRLNAVYDASLQAIRLLNGKNPQFKAMPNRDLLLYNDHLLNENVNTIIVDGFFGTGKTSTVCSHLVPVLLEEVQSGTGIKKAFIAKPHEGVGKSYGALPGTLHEKTYYEFQSYTQYFSRFGAPGFAEYLMALPTAEHFQGRRLVEPILELLPFEYIRGRDIEEGWVVLDEAQNTSRKEVTTFISRLCDNAKAVVIGDTTDTQIDKHGNTPTNNGLAFAKEVYEGTKYTGIVDLQSVKHIIRGQRVRDLHKALKTK